MSTRTAIVAFLSTTLMGCQVGQPGASLQSGQQSSEQRLPPTLARMRQHYPDLHSGRFVILADFNDKAQAKLCRIVGADGRPTADQPAVSARHSVDATGAGGLEAHLASPHDRLLLDGRRSTKLALLRDWRAYNILLVNIQGPPGGIVLEFAAQSGTDVPARFTRTLLAEPGWHLYRFDLADLGAEIDLTDVRALSWRAPRMTAPLDLYLDDVILADNTRYVLNKGAHDGELYVFTRGRSTHIGVAGRFELAFCDGLIAGWYAGSEHNLTVRSGLGPWPLPLPTDWSARRSQPVVYDDPALFASWGERVAATQRLVEVSAFRVLIEGRWRFAPAPGASKGQALTEPPEHVWLYTIYPSGQLFVQATSRVGSASWIGDRVGFAIALDGRSGFVRLPVESRSAAQRPDAFVAMSGPGRDQPDLLWCPHDPRIAAQQLEIVSADERRIAVVVGDLEPAGTVETAHMLRFWPADIDGVPEALSFAADYQRPAALELLRGCLVTDASGDLNRDGYNESQGCYELAAQAGLLRVKLLPGPLLRHAPIFRVRKTAGAECWVYVDGRIVRDVGRDRAGDLLVTLAGAISSPLMIEVNARAAKPAP